VLSIGLEEASATFGFQDVLFFGTAALNGTLNIVTPPNFTPAVGSRFEVLEADGGPHGGFSGAFSTINIGALGNGLKLVLDTSDPFVIAFVVVAC
jgi:hypothetical protein